jgi:hypothetical protein
MLIGRIGTYYRPYYVLVNNKWYKVDKIKFYKDNEIMVESHSGWLEKTSGGDIVELELPVEEVKLKRKESFDGKVFIISKGKEQCGNDTIADLYIPADMLGIHFSKHEIKYQQLRAVYEGEQDIYISTVIKNLTDKLYAIREEYENVYKELNDSVMNIEKEEIVLAKIDELKRLAIEFKAEKKRVHDLTIDDIEI